MDQVKLVITKAPIELTTKDIVCEKISKVGFEQVFSRNEPLYLTINATYLLQKQHIGKKGINESGKNKLSGVNPPIIAPTTYELEKTVVQALDKVLFNENQIVCSLVVKNYDLSPRVEITIERKPKLCSTID